MSKEGLPKVELLLGELSKGVNVVHYKVVLRRAENLSPEVHFANEVLLQLSLNHGDLQSGEFLCVQATTVDLRNSVSIIEIHILCIVELLRTQLCTTQPTQLPFQLPEHSLYPGGITGTARFAWI
jgi:hypothetical protein